MDNLQYIVLAVVTVSAMVVIVQILVRSQRRKKKYSPFTEKTLRAPGYKLGLDIEELRDQLTNTLLYFILIPIFSLLPLNSLSASSKVALFILVVLIEAYLAFRLAKQHKKLINLRLGQEGEVYTGMELNFLMREGAFVYHDLPTNNGNIDHVVISTGGVFAIETKAVRKPSGNDGKRQSRVSFKNGKLIFPHWQAKTPITQAEVCAKILRNKIQKRIQLDIPVTPVVAIPGWFIESGGDTSVRVINPKRGDFLRSQVTQKLIPEKTVELIANYIEEFVRTVQSGSDKFDPDADSKYTFWLDRKPKERRLE